MKLSIHLQYFLILSFLCLGIGCQNSSSLGAGVNSTKDPATLGLKLKRGMKILVAHRQLNPAQEIWGQPGIRMLTLEEPSGAEGLVFSWINSPENPSLANDPSSAPPQAQVYDLDGVQNGKMSLPNQTQARRMTLPLFWPSGDLFLSDSSGIWFSDAAFEELRKNKTTQWNPGLLGNALLGPAEGIGAIENGLNRLQAMATEANQGDSKGQAVELDGVEKYLLKVDGKNQEVEVLAATNDMATYKILNNAQNPIILELTLAPKASQLQILLSPLGILKGLVEYRIVEVQSPEFQAKHREPGTVKEM